MIYKIIDTYMVFVTTVVMWTALVTGTYVDAIFQYILFEFYLNIRKAEINGN